MHSTYILSALLMIPMLSAIGILLFSRSGEKVRALVALGGSVLHFVCSMVAGWMVFAHQTTLQLVAGDWPLGIGITLAVDGISALFLVAFSVVCVLVFIFALSKYFYLSTTALALTHILLLGSTLALLTRDLFNLYVAFEILLLSSFVLMSERANAKSIFGSMSYVTINLVASSFFLIAVGVLFGKIGTLNFTAIAQSLAQSDQGVFATSSLALLLVAFLIKAAAFPFFFWLPESYHTPKPLISALFAGTLTKIGVYSLIRLFEFAPPMQREYFAMVVYIIAILTMVIGVWGAYSHMTLRQLLSFHIISQIGYMLIAITMWNPKGIAAALYYTVHNIFAKTALFFIAALLIHRYKTEHIKKLGGLLQRNPYTAILFALAAIALAGLPPLSGFWAKFVLLQQLLEMHNYIGFCSALLVSLFTFLSMLKIWNAVFFSPVIDAPKDMPAPPRSAVVATTALVAISVLFGLGFDFFYTLCLQAAEVFFPSATGGW